jgi:hypothetical protein
MLLPTRRHSYSLTNRSTEGVCCMVRRDGQRTRTPIPANGTPLVRITVLRKSGGFTLLLSMHHSIADVLSSAFVIRDILEALSGKPLQPLTLTEPQESLCSAAASTSPPPPPEPAYSPATLLRRDVGGPTIQALKLSRELTMKLRTHAREVGATVHGALVAAFTFAGRQLSSDWLTHSVRVVSPENNRSVLPFETSFGDFKLTSRYGGHLYLLALKVNRWLAWQRSREPFIFCTLATPQYQSFSRRWRPPWRL